MLILSKKQASKQHHNRTINHPNLAVCQQFHLLQLFCIIHRRCHLNTVTTRDTLLRHTMEPLEMQVRISSFTYFLIKRVLLRFPNISNNQMFFSAPYNAPYMQSGPNLQAAPAPDMYQNMTSQFRMSGAINQPPYNQQQQLNNQSTVLISSTSNSLMSATVKPSSQIGAIGTKVNAGN